MIKKFLGGLVPTRAGYLTEPHSPEPKRLLEPMATDISRIDDNCIQQKDKSAWANNPWTVRYVSFPVLSFKPVLDAFDRVLAEWSRCVFFGIVCRELLAKEALYRREKAN